MPTATRDEEGRGAMSATSKATSKTTSKATNQTAREAAGRAQAAGKARCLTQLLADARSGQEVKVLCLDTETTGVTDDDRVTQFSAAMLTLSGSRDVERFLHADIEAVTSERYDAFCNPRRRMSPGAERVTGITNAQLRSYPTFAQGIRGDAQRLVDEADIIVGHNVGFDIKKLRHEGVRVDGKLAVDTMFDFRDMCKYRWGIDRPEKNLTAAVGMFGYSFDAHNSANDVDATLYLLARLAAADEVCSRPVDEIVKMHNTHSRRVAAYLRRFQKGDAQGQAKAA